MIVLAIDPGTFESAYVCWDGSQITSAGKLPNHVLLASLERRAKDAPNGRDTYVIEQVRSYGMAVGAEVFQLAVDGDAGGIAAKLFEDNFFEFIGGFFHLWVWVCGVTGQSGRMAGFR